MGRSSVRQPSGRTTLRTVRSDGTPVYRYTPRLGAPPVWLTCMDSDHEPITLERDHRHAHDFWVLVYVEHGDGVIGIDGRDVPLRDGALYGVPPGQVIGAGSVHAFTHSRVLAVAFTPDAIPALASISPLALDHHPLLALFAADGALVPTQDRPRWTGWLAELEEELAESDRIGTYDAVAAVLTRMLVASARLAPTTATPPDPLVARVFDEIEARYRTSVSAAEIARSLGYTAGYLTTVLRRRTGRTLGEWITERRLTEVRRLLRETELPLGVIAVQTGLGDASYLVRRFRGRFGVTPERWRRSQRSS